MVRPQYCVYNQTSECFLSLGVTHEDSTLAHLSGLLASRGQRYDEGKWVEHPRGIQFFRLFASRDLVFLDEKHCVVGALESFPPFKRAPIRAEVASVLALPVHTISSSQTRPGNQLVICMAEELEFRLRRAPEGQGEEWAESPVTQEILPAPRKWNSPCPTPDRRSSRRKRWPRLVAYDSMGGALEVHGVKDMSANGLYLITEERWPLGSHVTMTLQRTDAVDDDAASNTITVELRVVRWGSDGVGLAFIGTETEEATLLALSSSR